MESCTVYFYFLDFSHIHTLALIWMNGIEWMESQLNLYQSVAFSFYCQLCFRNSQEANSGQDETVCKFSAYIAFDKVANIHSDSYTTRKLCTFVNFSDCKKKKWIAFSLADIELGYLIFFFLTYILGSVLWKKLYISSAGLNLKLPECPLPFRRPLVVGALMFLQGLVRCTGDQIILYTFAGYGCKT